MEQNVYIHLIEAQLQSLRWEFSQDAPSFRVQEYSHMLANDDKIAF